MLFDDFRTNYALWLWVPHRASLVRDDEGGFGFKQPTKLARARAVAAKQCCPSIVIASAAKQSMAHPQGRWIASLRSQ